MPTTFNLRIFLWALLLVAVFLNVQMWQRDYPPPPPVPPPALNAVPLDSTAPTAAPVAAPAGAVQAVAATSTPAPAPGQGNPATAPHVHVVTDVLDVDVSLAGGELSRADLSKYALVKGQPQPVRLLNRDSATSLYVLQSGLAGAQGLPAPTHLALYASAASELRLADGAQELRVPLSWSDGRGVTVTKTYVFRRGSYIVGLEYTIQNASGSPWVYQPYARLQRYNPPVKRSMFNVESYAYKGPAYFDGTRYQKLPPGDKDTSLDRTISNGWIAALQHHFVSAIVPPADHGWQYQLKQQGEELSMACLQK